MNDTSARQPPQGDEPVSALTLLADEADRLAEGYDIPTEQARVCLDRLVAAFGGDLIENSAILDRALHRFPLSLLEDSLVALPKEVAFRLILEEDLQQLAQRIQTVEWLLDQNTPFYTLEVLAGHVERFQKYLQEHREFLTQTGLPTRSFPECPWLYHNLARLYDTRTTSNPWPREGNGPSRPPRDVEDPLNPPPYTWVKTPRPTICMGGDITPCQYHEADYLNGMGQDDADRLEDHRDRLFATKLRVLELLAKSAREQGTAALWAAFLKVLADAFTAEDVAFLFRMDNFYLKTDARLEGGEEADPTMVPGGLTNWIEALGHVEKEVTIGTLARARKKLPEATIQKLVSPPWAPGEYRWAYFNLVGQPEKAQLDTVLRQLFQRGDKERKFWAEFRERVSGSLNGQIRVPISVFVPRGAPPRIQSFLQQRADEVVQGRGVSAEPAAGAMQGGRVHARFPSPQGLKWSEVKMEFVSERELRITVHGKVKRYTYTDLGFQDRRKGDVPDKLWTLLRCLADQGGVLARDNHNPQPNNIRKSIQLICDRLRAVMDLNDIPIPYDKKGKKYQCKFKLHMATLRGNLANADKEDPDEH